MSLLKGFGQFLLFSVNFLWVPLFIICGVVEPLIKVGLGTWHSWTCIWIKKRPKSLPAEFTALGLNSIRPTHTTWLEPLALLPSMTVQLPNLLWNYFGTCFPSVIQNENKIFFCLNGFNETVFQHINCSRCAFCTDIQDLKNIQK